MRHIKLFSEKRIWESIVDVFNDLQDDYPNLGISYHGQNKDDEFFTTISDVNDIGSHRCILVLIKGDCPLIEKCLINHKRHHKYRNSKYLAKIFKDDPIISKIESLTDYTLIDMNVYPAPVLIGENPSMVNSGNFIFLSKF